MEIIEAFAGRSAESARRPKEVVPALVRRLTNYDIGMAETAAEALRQIDPEAAKAADVK